MSEVQALAVELRPSCGKGHARRARMRGLVPAILYGGSKKPIALGIEERLLNKILRHDGFLATQFNLELDGKKHHVLPRGIQFDPVTDRPIHVDFMRVTDKTRIRVMVHVSFLNEDTCVGLKRGGVLNVVRHEIELVCAVAKIPEHLEVDLEGFEIGETIHFSHIDLPKGVSPVIDDRDFTIATIAAPTVAVETEEAEGVEDEEAAEGEDKETEEGEQSS